MYLHVPAVDVEVGGVRLSTHGLLGLIKSIHVNKNNDKTLAKGKRRAKLNRSQIELANPDGGFDYFLRGGKRAKIWLGYEGYPLITGGVHYMEDIQWKYGPAGKTVSLQAYSYDNRLTYNCDAEAFYNVTHTEAARRMCEAVGMGFHGTDSRIKIPVLMKGPQETHLEALERWADDVGFEVQVDDTVEPNVLYFGPAVCEEPSIIDGRVLTIGPTSDAVLPTFQLKVHYRYQVPQLSITKLMEDGKANKAQTLVSYHLDPVAGLFATGKQTFAEKASYPQGTTPPGQEQARLAANAMNMPPRMLVATFKPGIPFFRLGLLVPLVGCGDQNGLYRVLDITHYYSVREGLVTTIKAARMGRSSSQMAVKKGTEYKRQTNFKTKDGQHITGFFATSGGSISDSDAADLLRRLKYLPQ